MAGINENFSIPLGNVFAHVQGEVKQAQQNEILPEHLLLSLLKEKNSAAYRVFVALNVDLAAFEDDLRISLTTRPPAEEDQEISMSEEVKRALGLSLESQSVIPRPYLGTEHLLVGMLRDMSGRGYSLLRKAGVSYNHLLDLLKKMPSEAYPESHMAGASSPTMMPAPTERLTPLGIFKQISPVFWGLLLLTVFFAAAAYYGWVISQFAVFMFVILGWVVSVSLHEFGHAVAAYYGGDQGVIRRGYLSLNPLKYTHGFMSIVLPVIVLLLGGIGLPGGAVFINMEAIRDKRTRSLVSAAGPIMTGALAFLLALPFILGLHPSSLDNHGEFWGALAFLAFVELWAFIFNLIPIPGFDGFGILRPFLPQNLTSQINRFGSLILFGFIALYLSDTFVQRWFWGIVMGALSLLNVDVESVRYGLSVFHFW